MQINRLFEMLYLLLARENVTAGQLAERFGVSVRTVYRDIDILSASGVPVYAQKGKGGGIRLLEGFVMNRAALSQREQEDIISGLQALSAANVPDIKGVLTKLFALFNRDDKSWIEVDFSDWSWHGHEKYNAVKAGILNKKVVEFDYYSQTGAFTHREAEPVQLWFKDRAWYVRAYCLLRNDERLFKLNRMRNLRVTDKNADLSRPAPPPAMPEAKGPPPPRVAVSLRISATMAHRVYDEFNDCLVTRLPDGDFAVTANFVDDEWLYDYFLSFGAYAEVVAPPSVREAYLARLKRILALYEI